MNTYESPVSIALERLTAMTPFVCALAGLYVAAFGVAIWKRWPLSMGILMLPLGFLPAVWVIELHEFNRLGVLYGWLAIPVVLMVIGFVSAAGRYLRQQRKGFHDFD